MYETVNLDGREMRSHSIQLWDGGHMLERILLHALEPSQFTAIRDVKQSIQNVTTFFRLGLIHRIEYFLIF